MRVFIVVSYLKQRCLIYKVYSTREAAVRAITKLNSNIQVKGLTFHIITKGINGLIYMNKLLVNGRSKIVYVDNTTDHLRLRLKVINQRELIKKLEFRIQELKVDLLGGQNIPEKIHPSVFSPVLSEDKL